MNTYNIYNEQEPSCILFHAIAESPIAVALLAEREGLDITGLTIELERTNVKDESGRPFPASIKSALVV